MLENPKCYPDSSPPNPRPVLFFRGTNAKIDPGWSKAIPKRIQRSVVIKREIAEKNDQGGISVHTSLKTLQYTHCLVIGKANH